MATLAPEAAVSWLPTKLLVAGQLAAGEGPEMTVRNPSSGEVTASFPGASLAQFHSAIAAARAAADKGEWANTPLVRRVAKLRALLDLMVARSDDLRSLIVTETGIPIKSFALEAQVGSPLKQMEVMLDLCLKLPELEENPISLDERINAQGGFVQSIRRYVPVGVVAAISAYNFPLHINLWKLMPALATGNSVILRPSPLTPFSAFALAEIVAQAGLPEGVVSILAEAGAEGAQLLTTDPRINMVSFTGSTEVGGIVAGQAAPSMKRLQLELGGKSAQIYLPDRVEAAATAAIGVCMAHAGQGCVLGTRIFVPQERKAEVLQAMKASLAYAVIGDSTDPATTMGPVISESQVNRCARYVELAVAAGASVVAGGKRADRPGYFFEPTILDVPDNSNPAAQDEIFGPVVAVIGYRDVDHAVEMANDSPLGLSGYVYGKDARQALDVAKRIHTGTINVNAFFASANSSSGGHKMSGIGRERGVEGIRAFQDVQVMNLGSAT
ncbi:aldehyde dehydrogenase [Novosphingobium barchaimii LL02]|uniref:Aldehyde dehydrogenase n=1 Tax=Novosphingobium barchaimii LL02 TaxID=1114963 RepID=A0A0J7XJ20_9SPHN|nr:aldehyde dehydrogenase family protein [Novosphingobium barchaimii]KMS51649.1 aldehyde dehydrogenase [Novosphingobium barchaimii LL02]